MYPALGSVTEGFLTQITSHTFRGYVSGLGSPERLIRSALPMSLAVALELSWCARLGIEPRTY